MRIFLENNNYKFRDFDPKNYMTYKEKIDSIESSIKSRSQSHSLSRSESSNAYKYRGALSSHSKLKILTDNYGKNKELRSNFYDNLALKGLIWMKLINSSIS